MDQFDIVILGSGFGGSLTAAILSREGMSVAMIDRDRHPRFSLGESSTPAADLILHDLAKRYGLKSLLPLVRFGDWQKTYPDLLCGCKRGFSYFWHGGEEGFQASPDHRHELFVAANASREVADTQWYRPDVDTFFCEQAKNESVQVFESAVLKNIDRDSSWKLSIDDAGTHREIQAGFLIDATGTAGVLLRHLKIEDQTHRLKTSSAAIAGHWEDLPPLEEWLKENGASTEDYPFPPDDSAVHHVFPNGWAWQLRFENGLTSFGSVFPNGFAPNPETPAEKAITHNRPALAKLLANRRLAEFPGRYIQTGRMQRLWSQGAGEGWAALPFTIGFIDPLHSTGIAHTLCGIERLAEILLKSPAEDRTGALANYSNQIIQELLLIDLLVSGCYLGLVDFRLFSAWSMLYFAAATCFEKNRLGPSDHNAGFLLADDPNFTDLLRRLYQSLREIVTCTEPIADSTIADFEAQVRSEITPYNHVGLFAPEIPNMYHYTAAEK